jgi:hypothetical protein
MNGAISSDRIPLKQLFAFEIANGTVNAEKLEKVISASMEFVNSELKAFDTKKKREAPLRFGDSMIVWIKRGEGKIPVMIISPRFELGKYRAKRIVYGDVDGNGKPCFTSLKRTI